MRLARVILAVGLACATGCTTGRLRQRTINQASTLPELQYQQVLNNLAAFAANPAALPWHVNLREGTTQITDSITGGSLVDLGPPAVTQPQLFGSRTAVAQWGMSPVIDATELRLLRIAYRRAHGLAEMPDPEFLDELAHELKDQFASNSDLRDESELFYENQSRVSHSSRELDARTATTNDDSFCTSPGRQIASDRPWRGMCVARSTPSSAIWAVLGRAGSASVGNGMSRKALASSGSAAKSTPGSSPTVSNR